ncbi:ATP-NAD kinase-like domain-containing protein [Cynara cardunculus var. scolymus]|uniref:Diacylglycerol kinase n=1 Tax=Cynara cardunculus var. scolymus TaxID=59895 RepID=A0A118JRY7_CYNCS|nr:ATP-NAD kinase-like domain-containing protein [Cynara cardunculus var. scolymus]
MASSSGPDPAMNKAESKASMIESIKGRSMSGVRVSRGDLRRKMTMPAYLRLAIRDAIAAKSIDAGKRHYGVASLCLVDDGGGEKCPLGTPESPVVVFVNSKSGGRQGYALKSKLQNLMGEEQVLDLQTVKPHEFVEYGLGCLENFAALGDSSGGDGTVGWVLGCLGELHKQGRDPVPPTAIIPLGTGNDLSRNFGWGGSFPFNWKTAIKKTLDRVLHAPLCRLDSWNLVISMPAGVELDTPHALKQTEEVILDQDLENAGRLPEQVSCYQGVFYNYFSIGMDAQVAYSFHHLRNEKPYLAQSPIANKIIYSGYSCKQGWFFTPCMTGPSLSVRSVVALNLHSYASGRNPWGNLKPEYLEKRGFVEAKADDGLLEIFGFKQGWHASFVMVDLISAKHIAQASEIRFELRGGAWKEGFMQMDGEPWKQPMNNDLIGELLYEVFCGYDL